MCHKISAACLELGWESSPVALQQLLREVGALHGILSYYLHTG